MTRLFSASDRGGDPCAYISPAIDERAISTAIESVLIANLLPLSQPILRCCRFGPLKKLRDVRHVPQPPSHRLASALRTHQRQPVRTDQRQTVRTDQRQPVRTDQRQLVRTDPVSPFAPSSSLYVPGAS